MSKHADELLREWFKKATTLEAAHIQASNWYYGKDTWIAIPSIILSVLSGSLAFSTTGFPDEIKNTFLFVTGGISIVNTIIASIKEYFSWSQKHFNHGATALAYQKLKNNIEIQLALHKMGIDIPYERIIQETGTMLTKIENESPQLPKFIVEKLQLGSAVIDIMVDTNTDQENDSDIKDIIERYIKREPQNQGETVTMTTV
jgi:hypothetical protein